MKRIDFSAKWLVLLFVSSNGRRHDFAESIRNLNGHRSNCTSSVIGSRIYTDCN